MPSFEQNKTRLPQRATEDGMSPSTAQGSSSALEPEKVAGRRKRRNAPLAEEEQPASVGKEL